MVSGKAVQAHQKVLAGQDIKTSKVCTLLLLFDIYEMVDKYRRLRIRTNADQPDQCVRMQLHSEQKNRTLQDRAYVCGDRPEVEKKKKNFSCKDSSKVSEKRLYEIFRVMDGLPVTIRTLDPPLHEFLPHTENEITKLAELIGTKWMN